MSWNWSKVGRFGSREEAERFARDRRIDEKDFDARSAGDGAELWVRDSGGQEERRPTKSVW